MNTLILRPNISERKCDEDTISMDSGKLPPIHTHPAVRPQEMTPWGVRCLTIRALPRTLDAWLEQ